MDSLLAWLERKECTGLPNDLERIARLLQAPNNKQESPGVGAAAARAKARAPGVTFLREVENL